MRFGAVYGFRNIQQITKMLKQNACDYDFLEIMACPRGCTNGGGQLKPSRDSISRAELIEKVNFPYFYVLLIMYDQRKISY